VPGGYAWLGAPWFQYGLVAEGEMYGGNGGFSLRRRSAMLDITSRNNWTEGNEDMWFADHIRDSGGKWHMARQNVAMHFAYVSLGLATSMPASCQTRALTLSA